MNMTWAQVCARRLARHGLAEPVSAANMAEQVGVICGAHAQIITAAELSVGLRVEGATRATVRQALWNDHSLIKTYGHRGTVHLLPAHDLAMWTGALTAVPPIRRIPDKDRLMTRDQTEAVIEAIDGILENAELTMEELTEALVAKVGAWAGDLVMEAFQGKWARWREAMDTAANRGVLIFGANRGSKVTYTNPRRWIPGFRPEDGEKALAGVVKRYLYAYGPATPPQFARWINGKPAWAAELFEALAGELEQVELEGSPAWVVKGDTEVPSQPPQGVRLLPYFDAYGVGAYPRERVFPGRAAQRALAGGQAGNFPVLLIDGMVAGVWHQRRSGKKIDITVEPLDELSAAHRRELEAQVERVGEILEGTPKLTTGIVTVGAHA